MKLLRMVDVSNERDQGGKLEGPSWPFCHPLLPRRNATLLWEDLVSQVQANHIAESVCACTLPFWQHSSTRSPSYKMTPKDTFLY